MQKIISLFKRDYDGARQIYDEVVEGAEWVVNGEGDPTEKVDGTCCMVKDGKLYKRYDAKKGKQPPAGFEPTQPEPDPNTGHWPGWLLVGDGPDEKWHRQAIGIGTPPDGTYELIGPKIQGNKYHLDSHVLIPHGHNILDGVPRDFAGLKAYFENKTDIEGVVWHHEDGRMVKIKRRDFGLRWEGTLPNQSLQATVDRA